ncbi:hypothetical protein AC579_2088 [Pseudocercospora musae]|uniref:Uncharacterized protein n=1 Tax=Pseudocercospora musae TaxID=113226 RepID=A0A139I553_9PEZI|nr:hypothetical protein AC579_2088 [Pseudocercospora musae]
MSEKGIDDCDHAGMAIALYKPLPTCTAFLSTTIAAASYELHLTQRPKTRSDAGEPSSGDLQNITGADTEATSFTYATNSGPHELRHVQVLDRTHWLLLLEDLISIK